ncbi:MAG: saccharopine dehydrogenase NADP-binding domain-containing protein [Jiangellales bacterium]
MTEQTPDLDIVLYGATGFTGRLVAEYLAGADIDGVSIGLAGRSPDKVRAVRDGLGPVAAEWPLIVADASDADSLAEMAERTSVVISAVGPYAQYGLPLVQACASTGTHYVDLTGEVLFMNDSIASYDAMAAASGARIVHSCGFDSIPSDLGVFDLAQRVAEDGAGELTDTTLVVTKMRGGLSGGTLASGMAEMTAARKDPERKALLRDPYSLSPDRAAEPDLGDESDPRGTFFDEQLGQWVGPFFMAGINTRVVRRSNALLGYAYGRTFRYQEVMGLGTGPDAAAKGAALAAGMGGLGAMMSNDVTGKAATAVANKALPKPGEGPDEESRRKGHFTMKIHASTTTGAQYVETVAAQGDPGYAATCVMLGEAALCLVRDISRLPDVAGVLTPSVAFGSVLVERLRQAGMTFDTSQ